jgi:hypothetical protein
MIRISVRGAVVLVAVGAALLGIIAFCVEELRRADRAANERSASMALRQLASVEAEFRANDRDKNGVNDFWTGDISGLYSLDVGAGALQLIPREIAEADAAPLKPLVPAPVPYKGYLFRVLEVDHFDMDPKNERYQQDTGGKPPMGNVHHPAKFAFIAYPARYPTNGKYSFVVSESNTVFRKDEDWSGAREWDSNRLGIQHRHDTGPPTPVRQVRNAAAELPRTTVTAHLAEKHAAGKNLIWCASVQTAWDQLGAVLKQPLDLEGDPEMARGLNRKLVQEADLPPGKFYARAGFFKDGIVQTIRSEMALRFPKAPMPSWPAPTEDDEALAFASLHTDLPFGTPLFRHAGISFNGTKVAAFGLWDSHGKVPTPDQMKQVIVRDFQSDRDFVVELYPKGGEERIIVARVTPGATLLETVTSVMARLDRPPAAAFTVADDLMIPCINFDLIRSYSEVTGPSHRIKGRASWIGDAQQMIRFRFDEQGALLGSYSYIDTSLNGDPPKGRKMICDGPFLILLARSAGRMPYFAFWVDNDELLIR